MWLSLCYLGLLLSFRLWVLGTEYGAEVASVLAAEIIREDFSFRSGLRVALDSLRLRDKLICH